MTDYYLSGKKTIWVENIFTATDDELLAAVSTTFRKTTNYELSIYVNDELMHTSSGTCKPGYTTINLGGYVPLKKGDKFRVVFKLTGKNVEFAISKNVTMNKITYSPGVSFFSTDGVFGLIYTIMRKITYWKVIAIALRWPALRHSQYPTSLN